MRATAGKAAAQEKPNEIRLLPPAKMCQTKLNFKALAAGKASKAKWQGLACCRRQSQQNQMAKLNLLPPAKQPPAKLPPVNLQPKKNLMRCACCRRQRCARQS